MFRANTPDIKHAEHMLPIKRTRRLMKGWVGVIRRSFSARRTSVCRTVMLFEGVGGTWLRTHTHSQKSWQRCLHNAGPTYCVCIKLQHCDQHLMFVRFHCVCWLVSMLPWKELFFLTFRCFESFQIQRSYNSLTDCFHNKLSKFYTQCTLVSAGLSFY